MKINLDSSYVVRPAESEDGDRLSRRGGWRCSQAVQTSRWWLKRMVAILTIHLWNQMLKEPNVKNKAKKTEKKKIVLLPTVWKCGLSKTPPYHRASSPWAYMRISHHRFQVSELKIQTSCCSAPAPCFARNQSDVNRCLYLEERRFFVVIQTTSKHLGSVVSVPSLLSRWRRGGGAFIVSASTQRHLARLFLSLLRLMWRASTKQDLEAKRGEHVGWCRRVSVLSLPVNLYNVFFLYVWVRIVIYFNVNVFCVFDCFALTSAFTCTVAVSCFVLFLFIFLIWWFSHNCYSYCIVTIVSLFYCIFIWQLWRHVVHYKKKI